MVSDGVGVALTVFLDGDGVGAAVGGARDFDNLKRKKHNIPKTITVASPTNWFIYFKNTQNDYLIDFYHIYQDLVTYSANKPCKPPNSYMSSKYEFEPRVHVK